MESENTKMQNILSVLEKYTDMDFSNKIDIKSMIEADFATIHFKATLRDVVESIKHSKRKTYPVIKKNNKLLGIIYLDNVREEMFNAELYDKVTAK